MSKPTKEIIKEAYCDGYASGQAGVLKNENPYWIITRLLLWISWNLGREHGISGADKDTATLISTLEE